MMQKLRRLHPFLGRSQHLAPLARQEIRPSRYQVQSDRLGGRPGPSQADFGRLQPRLSHCPVPSARLRISKRNWGL